MEIVMWVVVGLIAGWLGGSTMKGGYGLIGDVAVAVVGAIVGVSEADRNGLVGPAIAGLVSAGAFVGLARLLTRRVAPA
jgi:uncharacterized membrane protein YeaQ/YmgE (transglycosylase-associated protein family)